MVGVEATDAVMATALNIQPGQIRLVERRRRTKSGRRREEEKQSRNEKTARLPDEVAEVRGEAVSGLARRCLGRRHEWSIERATEVPLALVVARTG